MAPLVQQLFKKAILFFGVVITGCNTIVERQAEPVTLMLLNNADTGISNVNGVLYFRNQLLSGVLFTLYPGTSDTATKSSFLKGREHGNWFKFYPDGKMQEQRVFENGKKTGTLITWWPSGNKQTHCQFLNDEYEGTSKEWTDNGMLVKEMNYKNGQEEGWQRWWHDNGKVRSNYIIKQGRRYGLLGTKHCVNVSDSIFKN
jgi:antitoxin component YwqK of YwqJK toxin-antitoxin module